MGDMGEPPKKKRRVSVCVGCGGQIHDQYILRVSPDLEWHAACLKCTDCKQYLDETCTCFVRDGKTYCKRDYIRLFGIKCAKCSLGFSKTDFVMRVRNQVYHLECFRCMACSRQLIPGDEFALREDGLFCRADHELMERAAGGDGLQSPAHGARQLQLAGNHAQCNCTPTSTVNVRITNYPSCMQNLQGMTGTPLVAGSPVRQDSGLQVSTVEVQSYHQPPWKALTDFALQSELEQGPFQQLVSNVNFSEGRPGSNSTGSEITSLSQLPDTPTSIGSSPIEA
uniref:ISL LIM homeobox 1a n=1 Tax=Eptatretus burgeri TaxID=7764 RepID=A0A8C4RAA9_EPTBU